MDEERRARIERKLRERLDASEVHVIDEGRWQIGALSWPATVVGGRTPNIQKNIIAERFLGLPMD